MERKIEKVENLAKCTMRGMFKGIWTNVYDPKISLLRLILIGDFYSREKLTYYERTHRTDAYINDAHYIYTKQAISTYYQSKRIELNVP